MSFKFNRLQFLLLFFLFCGTACTRKSSEGDTTAKKYSIYILAKDGKEYLLQSKTLDKGLLMPEQEGAELNSQEITRSVIVKNGYYYHLNRKKGTFVKYKLSNRSLIEVGSVPLKDFSIENFYWKGSDTLLLTGLNVPESSQVKYAIVTTAKMGLIAEGNMDIPLPSGRFDNMSVGFVELRNQKLFVGYTYHQQLSASNYTTSDTTYITTLNYPQMTAIKTDKDTRSTYPGGINTIQPYAFNDEQHNYYFMTCPGIALGNRPELPTAIMRIKSGSDIPDENYFFNLSTSATHNHAYGMWYLGNNKVIIRSERKDLFKGLGDHYSTPHFEFYVADLISKTTHKLDLPLDKGTRRQCVLINKDMAYISVNSSTEGNYIWIYHIKTGELKKGMQLAGNTDFIMRIDELTP
ncbi:hypothetical protein FBD94_06665 [Pedobacter hiemivivus]|uniref:DUF4374 domain-containing protein n=1 Tax=Pedobacter hiemivivus TaxID=2530454 RepID=A0A4U1GIS1_9SPHI|nr:hypothetical protein [Pedobacter hiemivivus]TKC64018.1 hypothetical protein FBD94_06665 [Pedobacter hiemivivus]